MRFNKLGAPIKKVKQVWSVKFDLNINFENESLKIKNKNLQEIKKFVNSCENIFENTKTLFEINWKDFLELFDKKNISRKECLLLPLRTVSKALKI